MNSTFLPRLRAFGRLVAIGTAAVMAALACAPAHAAEGDQVENTKKLDDRLKKYWGTEMREVSSLQKRAYRKDQRWEFELYSGVIPNDEFFSYYPLGGRIDYFFAE